MVDGLNFTVPETVPDVLGCSGDLVSGLNLEL